MKTIQRIITGILLYITGLKVTHIQNKFGKMVENKLPMSTPKALKIDVKLKQNQRTFRKLERRFERLGYAVSSDKVTIETAAFQAIGMKELATCLKNHWRGDLGSLEKDADSVNQGLCSEFKTTTGFHIRLLTYKDLTETRVSLLLSEEIKPEMQNDYTLRVKQISMSQRTFDSFEPYEIEHGLKMHFTKFAPEDSLYADNQKLRTTHKDINGLKYWIVSDLNKAITTIIMSNKTK